MSMSMATARRLTPTRTDFGAYGALAHTPQATPEAAILVDPPGRGCRENPDLTETAQPTAPPDSPETQDVMKPIALATLAFAALALFLRFRAGR
jgi:hypothetical protein